VRWSQIQTKESRKPLRYIFWMLYPKDLQRSRIAVLILHRAQNDQSVIEAPYFFASAPSKISVIHLIGTP
jgi:hypothetical protein